MTYVFLTILLFIRDQMGKTYQSIRTHPRDSSWLLGLYVGTYIISCSMMMTGLKSVIRFDGVFVVINLASVIANIISLLQVSNWVFTRPERSDVLRYIEEVKALTNLEK
jgi:hypothetical protein